MHIWKQRTAKVSVCLCKSRKNQEQTQAAPTPATIFSLFYNGKFATIDLSTCIGKQLDKISEIQRIGVKKSFFENTGNFHCPALKTTELSMGTT